MFNSPPNSQDLPQWLCHESDHRSFREDEFWKRIPAWRQITTHQFNDFRWQQENSVSSLGEIKNILKHRLNDQLMKEMQAALDQVPMQIKLTPYLFALIDWDNPIQDPLRRQYLPIQSQLLGNHPFHLLDTTYEDVYSPVQGLTHRYSDKVLFLSSSTCPQYCSYCTRSRLVGNRSTKKNRQGNSSIKSRWKQTFSYIRTHPEIEDVVISGGDTSMLKPDQIRFIGETLLGINHIRRIRLATKALAGHPMKVLSDDEWFRAVANIAQFGRGLGKHVCVHTHFSSPREITIWSQKAADRFFQEGITVRNQSVFQAGVNNHVGVMGLLIKQLSYMNIHPYYVFIFEMVPGCEHLRTTLHEIVEMEKAMRGITGGFNTPTFACDLPTGGGKQHVAAHDYYNQETGISVWRAPSVKPGKAFLYFDPIHRLSSDIQDKWKDAWQRQLMLKEALSHIQLGLRIDPFYDATNGC